MILVTGAAGFIGSHLVERLLADGHEVLGLDNFDPFYARAIKERNLASVRQNSRFRFFEVDICDPASLERGLKATGVSKLTAIVHLAARANVRVSLGDPMGFHQTNVMGTLHLLEFARKHGVPQFVFGSSSSVYGTNPRVPWREDDRELLPISPYAGSKLAGETITHVYAHAYGLRVVVLRFFNAHGPRQRPDLAIAKFARLARSGKPLPLFGDGSARRDYTYVADTVDGIVRALGYSATPFEIINLGNDQPVSLAELVAAFSRTFGFEPLFDRQPVQPGELPQTWADISKAKRLLGWAPRTSLEEGLQAFREWFEQTPAVD